MQIIVFGMHRSGTSMVTRLVNMMGAYVGPRERLVKPQRDNPAGFWEREDVMTLNEIILKAGGGAWWDIVHYSQDEINEWIRLDCTQKAREIVNSMEKRRPWVIKDPRMCVTFPLWRQVLENPVCIYVYRPPLEVARSLEKRNGFPIGMGIGLWESYNLHAAEASRGLPTFSVKYTELLAEPIKTAHKLYSELMRLGVTGLRLLDDDEIREYIDPRLSTLHEVTNERHYLNEKQLALAELLEKGSMPPTAECVPSAGGMEAQRVYTYTQYLERQIRPSESTKQDSYLERRDIQRKVNQFEAKYDMVWPGTEGENPEGYLQELKRQHSEDVQGLADQLRDAEERVEILRDWLVELDTNLGDVFASWRWRVGHAVISIVERVLLRGRVQLAKDHVVAVLRQFRDFDGRLNEPDLSELAACRGTQKNAITREEFAQIKRRELKEFLEANETLDVSPADDPKVSIVLVLFNRAELTLWCLRSIVEERDVPYEVVIVDNKSTDETGALLDRISGAKVIRNEENLGFVLAGNQGAEAAGAEYVLLLNNDSKVLKGSLGAALETMESGDDVGVVGGKLLMLDGRVQEGGSIVWNDGSCLGYGRGKSPWSPEVMFRREVDYCSGAFLLTPRKLFLEAGGLDKRFAPAYYEDSDYCMKIKDRGFRIIYEPGVRIVHFEFASSKSTDVAIKLQQRNREVFYDKHTTRLLSHYPPDPRNALKARFGTSGEGNVLYIDDRVPHKSLGSGFPRANLTIRALTELGYHVTVYPLNFPYEDNWETVYEDIPRETEVILGYGRSKLKRFMKQRAGYFNVVMISRPHNMEFFNQTIGRKSNCIDSAKVVYDAEALFAMRDLEQSKARGKPLSESRIEKKVGQEVDIARQGDVIFAVTAAERRYFLERSEKDNVYVLGHAVECQPTATPFHERSDLLFVGNLDEDDGPNVDSLLWFVDEVFPTLRNELGNVDLHVVGTCRARKMGKVRNDNVILHGRVSNLHTFYENARIFVAPTRFAAGIPYKVHEAAAHGLPVVATDILVSQLGWDAGEEILASAVNNAAGFAAECARLYTDERLWQRMRVNAVSRIAAECSRTAYISVLKEALESSAADRP